MSELAADLARVRQGRFFFHHHSVGGNILAGLERLDAEIGGGRLKIATVDEALALDGGLLAHGSGGRNGEPRSKIDSFAETIGRAPRLSPDVAFMKLCYVDFNPRTDVDALFSSYREATESLKREHPRIRFAHVTVPLFRRPSDLKSRARRVLRLEVWEDATNVRRSEFNQRLAEVFASDPIFDLARVEATGPGGRASTFRCGGRVYPSLHARYTDDGGHLNALGQRAAALAVVPFLVRALDGSGRVR